jgi:hypothetical protein
MFVGLLNYIWQFKRLDLAEGIWSYGQSTGWDMGEERADRLENRTILTPVTISLLAELIYELGGEDHGERHIPRVYSVVPGFTSHLSLLQIYLEGSMHGSIPESSLETLRAIRDAGAAGNPLVHALVHRYTDGDQQVATELLLTGWPADRLPTSNDWCEHWRVQRADGDKSLQPCSEGHTHSGGDFLLVAALILGRE